MREFPESWTQPFRYFVPEKSQLEDANQIFFWSKPWLHVDTVITILAWQEYLEAPISFRINWSLMMMLQDHCKIMWFW